MTRLDRDGAYGIGLSVSLLVYGALGLQLAQPGGEILFYLLLTLFPFVIVGLTIAHAVKLRAAWSIRGEWMLKVLSFTSAIAALSMALLIFSLFLLWDLPDVIAHVLGLLFLAHAALALVTGGWWFLIGRQKWRSTDGP